LISSLVNIRNAEKNYETEALTVVDSLL